MGMTMTEKILAAHAGCEKVEPGQLIRAKTDFLLANDITGPQAIPEFDKIGRPVFDPDKIALIPDHFVPNKDIKSAEQAKTMREFARKHNISHYVEVGRMGIEHVLLPEMGWVRPGEIIIGADSHTCTYGAIGAFATGVGGTDLGAAMATGDTWFKVPSSIKVVLTGSLPEWVCGKDVILTLIGKIGVDGARYQSLEFAGPGVANLSMTDRFTIANMAIEAGAKNGIFPVDEKTLEYLRAHGAKEPRVYQADADAEYERVIGIDLAQVKQTVAFPHLPENARTFDEIGDVKIDQVVIGSCTNGRLEDLILAAEVLRGRKTASHVRAIIIPATQQIYLDAMEMGLVKDFIEAGCVVSTPTCGPCLGGHMGILAEGERCVATTNRNFVGRMGHPASEVYLASPAVAAASAIAGKIAPAV